MQILAGIADPVKNFAVIYLVDISEVPDFNTMYELYDPCTTMFFFRNKHIMIDLGTGNNNKINWAMNNKQELIDIVETVYRGARKGRGLVVSPKVRGRLRVQQPGMLSNHCPVACLQMLLALIYLTFAYAGCRTIQPSTGIRQGWSKIVIQGLQRCGQVLASACRDQSPACSKLIS